MHLERVECLLKNVILRRIDFDGMCKGVWRISKERRQQNEIDQSTKMENYLGIPKLPA